MKHYVFDVDGTITASRKAITEEHKAIFLEFAKKYPVTLVTGSDRDKTIEQIGKDCYNACVSVYQNSGNECWVKDKLIHYNVNWVLPEDAGAFLAEFLAESEFGIRAGKHFEHRGSAVNFSVVGRDCNEEQRKQYVEFDKENLERVRIQQRFNEAEFKVDGKLLEASIGGETGLDITIKGADKSQILPYFRSEVVFFGDACYVGGNDYPIYSKCKEAYAVNGPDDTFYLLEEML